MKKSYIFSRLCLLIFAFSFVTSCNSQHKRNSPEKVLSTTNQLSMNKNLQIGDYVVGVFEDSKGNLWFSTLSKGIVRYDGNELTYDTSIGNRVGGIVEDSNADLWFGTHTGVYKYDGKTFTNYSVNDGLCDNLVSNILIDSKGIIWVGTWGGVCRFSGNRFINFPIPKPDIEVPAYQETTNWISEIMEDSKGNMWFGRDGYGALKYDGESFTHFTKEDGLASNNITDIQEDKLGNIWFSSRITEKDHPDADKRHGSGGVVKYNGKNFINFPNLEGLNDSDVFQIYRDSKDNIWISAGSKGVYKYDGKDFINFKAEGNETTKAVMSILEDSKGAIWLGCAGGLFRLESEVMVNIKTGGPWK
ncbi:MAG: ligand-binding sensor domain-containing protein [Saprospiraceae bacterium]|jgi:ligand-binding sensor domain-containing protein